MSTLCDPWDGSPPGSPFPGILQARTLEWVAISFSNAWKWKVKMKSLSHVWLWVTPWTAAYQAFPSMGFSRQEYWRGVPLPSPPDKTSAPQFYESRSQPGGQSSHESSRLLAFILQANETRDQGEEGLLVWQLPRCHMLILLAKHSGRADAKEGPTPLHRQQTRGTVH